MVEGLTVIQYLSPGLIFPLKPLVKKLLTLYHLCLDNHMEVCCDNLH